MASATTGARRARRVALVVVALAVLAVAVIAVAAARDDDPPRADPTTTTAATTPASITTEATTASTAAPASTTPSTTVAPNPGGDLVSVSPTRLLDTRNGTGVPAGRTALATLSIAGRTGTTIPGQVKAVALNVTVAEPTQVGYLTVSAAGSRPSGVSQIAFTGATASSLIVTKASPEGAVELRVSDGATSHLIVDLVGYFTLARTADSLSIVAEPQPVALLDTRPTAPLEPAKSVDVTLPAPQAGALLGVTATAARAAGFLTVYGGPTRPETSAVNFGQARDATGLTIVGTGSDRVVHVYNGSSAPVHVVVFQVARLVRGAPADGLALNVEGTVAQDGRSAPFPFRTVDTRGTATCANALGGGVSSIGSIFPKAKALLVSITVVNASIASFLTAYTGGAQPPPMATLNFDAREVRTNLAFVPVAGDRINLWCGGGNPEYIIDVLATLE